ncbi:Xylose activator XylR (AraC family) [Klebsiella pneumoniae]|nr:Xylose activator XylR (AraC family) [Klebsiella pneumoniae]
MFEKRHRITLLFNANKAYDRQVVEGVGEYLQASSWSGISLLKRTFGHASKTSKSGWAMALSPTMTIPKSKSCWPMSTCPSSASADLIISQSSTRRSTISPPTTPRWWKALFSIKGKRGAPLRVFTDSPPPAVTLGGRARVCLLPAGREGEVSRRGLPGAGDSAGELAARTKPARRLAANPAAANRHHRRHRRPRPPRPAGLRAAAYPVPEKLCVIGIDNEELTRYLSRVALSSVAQGTRQMGYQAANYSTGC